MRNTGKRVNVRSPIRQTLDTEMTAKASSRAGELILLGERLKGGGARRSRKPSRIAISRQWKHVGSSRDNKTCCTLLFVLPRPFTISIHDLGQSHSLNDAIGFHCR